MPILSMQELQNKYQHQLRKDMKDQDRRRFLNPDRARTGKGLYVLYVWRTYRKETVWMLAGFARLKPTPVRIKRWRKRLGIKSTEIMRVVELDIARLTGAGGPPLITRGVAKRKKNPVAATPVVVKRTHKRTDPSLSLCDYGKGSTSVRKCKHRAPWHVSYRTPRSVGRPVLKRRCTHHAWNDKFFPDIAHSFVRVERKGAR